MLPVLRTEIPGPKSRALTENLRAHESRNVTFVDAEGRFPIFWESAQDCLISDVDGNVLLDLTAAFGVASVGHSHPKVVAAISAQATKLIHGMGDVHPSALKAELAAEVCARAPGDLTGCIFGANGADAVESAIKTARLFSGKPGVLAFTSGYHGLSFGALALTHRDDFKRPFAGQIPPIATHVPYAHPSACVFECGQHCSAACLRTVEATLRANADTIGAVIVEPIQGRGGIVVPPDGWLAGLREICDRTGVLLVADEIFTGWCRTGDWFACEHEGVVPDILCVGKAMGGGVPISVCLGRREVMDAWPTSTGEAIHTSTFLGSPLACAASLAAIHVMEVENLTERAREQGAYFRDRLKQLAARQHHLIQGVRGRGLMIGLVFHRAEVALAVVLALLQRGIIVLPAGDGDVLEFVPPLTIRGEQIDFAVETLETVLTAF